MTSDHGARPLRFSERYGYTEVRDALQVDDMDDDLRNGLWNIVCAYYLPQQPGAQGVENLVATKLWTEFFKRTIDRLPTYMSGVTDSVRTWYFGEADWYEVYDFIEYLLNLGGQSQGARSAANKILEREHSAYRFVGTQITRLTSHEEIAAVEMALGATTPLLGVNHHLRKALELLANRTDPDYPNSIKESITAVEGLCGIVAHKPKASLGDALKALKVAGVGIHPALCDGFIKIYGYTSTADGIRHAALEEPKLGLDDATFFLVSCSAFTNYLIAKANAAGIELAETRN